MLRFFLIKHSLRCPITTVNFDKNKRDYFLLVFIHMRGTDEIYSYKIGRQTYMQILYIYIYIRRIPQWVAFKKLVL